jgi:hypothetical protein
MKCVRHRRRRRLAGIVAICDKAERRIVFLHGIGEKVVSSDLVPARRLLLRSHLILLLLDLDIGVIKQVVALAERYRLNVVIDPAPLMTMAEKISRAEAIFPIRTFRK